MGRYLKNLVDCLQWDNNHFNESTPSLMWGRACLAILPGCVFIYFDSQFLATSELRISSFAMYAAPVSQGPISVKCLFVFTETHGASKQIKLKSSSGEYRKMKILYCKIMCIYIHINKGLISRHFSAFNFDCDLKLSPALQLQVIQVSKKALDRDAWDVHQVFSID